MATLLLSRKVFGKGVYGQGTTYEETIENISDAIRLHIEERLQVGESIGQPGEH